MPPYVDLIGASGAAYRFHLADLSRSLSSVSGLFAVMSGKSEALSVLALEEAANLQIDAPQRFRAFAADPKAGLFIRLHVARAARLAELADLRAAGAP